MKSLMYLGIYVCVQKDITETEIKFVCQQTVVLIHSLIGLINFVNAIPALCLLEQDASLF